MPKKLDTAEVGRNTVVNTAMVFIDVLSFFASRAIAMLAPVARCATRLYTCEAHISLVVRTIDARLATLTKVSAVSF